METVKKESAMIRTKRPNIIRDNIRGILLGGVLGAAVIAAAWFLLGGSGEEDTSPVPETPETIYVCRGCGKEYINQFPYTFPWAGYPTELPAHEIVDVGETYYNGSISGATPVDMFQRVTGQLSSRDDNDFYRFTIDVTGSVVFHFSFDGSSQGYTYLWDGAVYGTDGTTVLNSGAIPIEEGEEITFGTGESSLEPGTYYLKISAAVGGNPLMNGYSDTDYHITFRPRCAEHTSITQVQTAVPTCSQAGELTAICNICDERISTKYLEPLGHAWSTWRLAEESFFSAIWGDYSRDCALCGEEETDTLRFHFLSGKPKTDPDALTVSESTWTMFGTAPCTSKGFVKTVCSVCGNVEVESKEPEKHTYGEWVTSESEDQKSRTCTVCGYVETKALAHIPFISGTMPEVGDFIQILQAQYLRLCDLWSIFPPVVRLIIELALLLAIIGIATSLIKSAANNYKEWKPMQDSGLMLSYFRGSGNHQRKLIYKDARELLRDKTWSWISSAGLAYRLGSFTNSSKVVMFLCSLAFLPLFFVGLIEMLFRVVIGNIFYFFLNIGATALLFTLGLISCILTPFFLIADGAMRRQQHCPHCYSTFKLPYFRCPHCGTVHQRLIPGKSGLFYARCSCGHFLPCSVLSKRDVLSAVCPKCSHDLATSNARQFSIQVIGGNSSGKTAFLAAFQHLYLDNITKDTQASAYGEPKDEFDALESMFSSGQTVPASDPVVIPYSLVHRTGGIATESLIFYDIPDEILLNEEYERSPLNFGYSNGIIIIIDPLSIQEVYHECSKLGNAGISGCSRNDPEPVIIHFINKFSEISGRPARQMSNVPVAVLITKCDLRGVRQHIGMPKIKSSYKTDPDQYQNDFGTAIDEICREYLRGIGLSNVINNLDSVFASVKYFPISAIGHSGGTGAPFEPVGVIEPVTWLAESGYASLVSQLKAVQDIVTADDFQAKETERILIERYAKAEEYVKSGQYELATDAFAALGHYRDSSQRVEKLKYIRYSLAVKQADEKDFDGAVQRFHSLGHYKDAAERIPVVLHKKADFLINAGDYRPAIELLESLGKTDTLLAKIQKTRYEFASHLIHEGDCITAVEELKKLGDYLDSKEKIIALAPELIKQGQKRGIKFGKYEWRVLEVQAEFALIVTEHVVLTSAYNDSLTDVTWNDSFIRKYLNSTFLNEFLQAEKRNILTAMLKTPDNPECGTPGGEDTLDKVFLLDLNGAKQFFTGDADRTVINEATGEASMWWWLRSSGGTGVYAAIVEGKGRVSAGGNKVNNTKGGIRPAILIKL